MARRQEKDAPLPRITLERLALRRLTCTINEAAEATGLCPATIYNRMYDGTLTTAKVGSRRLVHVDSLLKLLGIAEGEAA